MAARAGARSLAAFTLLEILLAVALIGLLSAGLVAGATHLLDGRARTPTEIFWESVREARRTALTLERETRLSFNAEEKAFVVEAEGGGKTFGLPEIADLSVSFMPALSTGGALLIGGVLVDTEEIESVTFYPDGTCTPFRVQFRTTGPARVLAIDPWTCAPVLTDTKSP